MMGPGSYRSTILLYASGAVVFVFFLLFACSAGKPFYLDNVDFISAAERVAYTGLPINYRGENNPPDTGIWYPPLFLYLLAAWIRLFSPAEAPVHMFGMVCAVAQGLVALEIVRTLFGRARTAWWTPFFWAVFLLHPYTIQTASITDIETTIHGPVLCAAVLAILRVSWRDGEWRTDVGGRRDYAWILLALVVCMWTKLTTFLLIYPFLFFLLWARLGVKRAALATAAITAGSVTLFLATYYLFGALTGLNVNYTFTFTLWVFSARGSSGAPGVLAALRDHWRNLRFMVPFMVSWTGLLPWVAVLAALWTAGRKAFGEDGRRFLHYALVLTLATATTGYYCAKVSTFGFAPFKYVFVYWGLILTAPLFLLARWDASPPRRIYPRSLLFGGIGLCVLYAVAAAWSVIHYRDSAMLSRFTLPDRWMVPLVPAALFLAGLAFRHYRVARLGLLAAALTLYCGIEFGVAAWQSKVPYSTTYDYGETGFLETVAFLQSNTGPDDIISSMKDIGYRTGRRYHENYQALYLGEPHTSLLRQAIGSGRIQYSVFTEDRGQDQLIVNPALRQWVFDHCKLVRSFGNYRIYQLTSLYQRQREADCRP
jgi:hypothetical protein